MRGLDVSPTWQPAIDWPAVAGAGISFAWLKVTEGTGWPAPGSPEWDWYPAQHAAAGAAGIVRGGYHFAAPALDMTSADAQAAAFLGRLLHAPGDLVPALDLETNPQAMNADQLAAWVRRWLAPVEHAIGQPCVIYSYPWFIDVALAGWNLDGRPLWLADPSATTTRPRAVTQLEQQTVPGIAGAVDVDQADTLPILGGPPTPAPTPPPPAADWTPTVRNLDLSHADTTPVQGPGVRPLQATLRAVYAPGLAVDGIAGPITRATLLGYQNARGLAADAIAGPVTYGRLWTEP